MIENINSDPTGYHSYIKNQKSNISAEKKEFRRENIC